MKEDEPDLQLLTSEEIAAMRANLEAAIQTSRYEWRVLQTLEHFQASLDLLRSAYEKTAREARILIHGRDIREDDDAPGDSS